MATWAAVVHSLAAITHVSLNPPDALLQQLACMPSRLQLGTSYCGATAALMTAPMLNLQVVLEVKGETQLRNLAAKLREGGVAHKLWIEQPEDFATCLATHPAAKSTVAAHFKKLKLCKGV